MPGRYAREGTSRAALIAMNDLQRVYVRHRLQSVVQEFPASARVDAEAARCARLAPTDESRMPHLVCRGDRSALGSSAAKRPGALAASRAH